MKRLLSILLALFSIFSCTFQDYEVGKSMETIITKATGAVYENDIPYSFQSVNNKEFWSTCKCFEDRIAACEVPEEYLSGMTTMALLKTCIDYPLIYCYSAYENELQAVKAISEFSNVTFNRAGEFYVTLKYCVGGYCIASRTLPIVAY